MKKILSKYAKKHVSLLEEVVNLTHRIEDLAKNKNIDELLTEVDNRERLINLISYVQNKMEVQIDTLKSHTTAPEILEILKSWKYVVSCKLREIRDLNESIVDILSKDKEQVCREIALVFKNRENLKGYLLNNVKR